MGGKPHMNKPEVELTINDSDLPRLPPLPEEYADIPFLHKSFTYELDGVAGLEGSERELQAELTSHKRDEHLGDAVLKLFVTKWILSDPSITPGICTRVESLLLCNDTLCRLAKGYGWTPRIKLGTGFTDSSKDTYFDKVHADCFEAYIGVLWRCMQEGKGDINYATIDKYFTDLLAPEIFPDLRTQMNTWRDGRNAKRKKHVDKLNEKHSKKLKA